jgi:deoxyribodipyrimidine photo-lyase
MIEGPTDLRVRPLNQAPVRSNGRWVLYWMTAFRRLNWNFALDRAIMWAKGLNLPLVVLEPLRLDYPWANRRLHTFMIQGMADNAVQARQSKTISYFPYVETVKGQGQGLLTAWADQAAVVITDDFPCFFIPRMTAAAAGKISAKLEAVDSNGLMPLRLSDRVFRTAQSFRRFMQKHMPACLSSEPQRTPLNEAALPFLSSRPSDILDQWPRTDEHLLSEPDSWLDRLPMNHEVKPAPVRGGARAADQAFQTFLDERLSRYEQDRNHPDNQVSSGLSPYLHFGHISVHQIFYELMTREAWTPEHMGSKADGRRTGWWGVSPPAEAFLDQVLTWREIGFNRCALTDDYDRYESLPVWARETLAAHESDPRPFLYTLTEFEEARTHDPLWNAAQGQLRQEGVIHNYLRMLWGKKILEWSPSPQDALNVMIELNNTYALDGRDPNSYSGIFWILGRYDHAWPARPVYGKIRSMTSANTARKTKLKRYLERYTLDEGRTF